MRTHDCFLKYNPENVNHIAFGNYLSGGYFYEK